MSERGQLVGYVRCSTGRFDPVIDRYHGPVFAAPEVLPAAEGESAKRDKGALVLLGLAVAAVVFVAFAVGYGLARSRAVCHSVTEDATITDCDYRENGWYPE